MKGEHCCIVDVNSRERGEAFLAYTIIIILMIISKQFLQVDIWTQIDFVHVQPLNFGQNLNQLMLLEKKKKDG